MDYTRSLLRILAEWNAVFLLSFFLVPNELIGRFQLRQKEDLERKFLQLELFPIRGLR